MRQQDESGSVVVEAILVIGFVLLVIMALTNLVVWSFTKGAVHSAVDQAARAGARAGPDAIVVCEDRANQVLGNLLASTGATLFCSDDGEMVRATVNITLQAWVPALPDSPLTATGASRKERLP